MKTLCSVKCELSGLFGSPEIFRDSVFLESQTLLIFFFYSSLKKTASVFIYWNRHDRKDATCTHVRCACQLMRGNSAMRWTVMIHENRKLKSIGSKVILLVTFSPRHLALMSAESLTLHVKHSYMKVNHEETGSFLCLFFCQIYVKFCLWPWVMGSFQV